MKDKRLVKFALRYGVSAANELVKFTQSVPFSLDQVIAAVDRLDCPDWQHIEYEAQVSVSNGLGYIASLPRTIRE